MSIKLLVGNELKIHPETRDSDSLLIAIMIEIFEDNLDNMTAKQLLNKIKLGKYGSFESIRRCRQWLQEHHEDLRGETYEKRQSHARNVSNQMRFNFG